MKGLRIALAAAVLISLLATAAVVTAQSGGGSVRFVRGACAPTLADRNVSVFTSGDYVGVNHEVAGRVVAAGDVSVRQMQIGTALAPNPDRYDLIAGGSIEADGTQTPNGSASYGTTFSGQLIAPNGSVDRAAPEYDLDAIYGADADGSRAWTQLPANGTVSGPTYGQLQFVGDDPQRNVFRISADDLQQGQRIQIRVPAGSTTLIDVTGDAYSSATLPSVSVELWNGSDYVQVGAEDGTDLDQIRRKLVWNFADARTLQIGPGIAWQGSILAPQADARLSSSTQIHGSVLAANVDDQATFFLRPFDGCLPPPEPDPAETLTLRAECVDPVTGQVEMLLRNSGLADVDVTWEDELSAQAGAFTARAQRDTWFEVEDGDRPHVIDVHAGSSTLTARTSPEDACAGTILIAKRVTGDGDPPSGRWGIAVSGDNGYERAIALGDGESRLLVVPGSIAPGSVTIGELPEGTRYVVREDDPRGAVVSTSRNPVTITEDNREQVVVGNDYSAPPTPPGPDPTPDPDPDPVVPPVTPPVQPTLPPDVNDSGRGPGLSLAVDTATSADVAISERIAPRRLLVGERTTVRVRVVNRGPQAALGVVMRELPQIDPQRPNRIARVLTVRTSNGSASCNAVRPVRCELGTLAAGASRTLVVRARMLRAGSFESVVYVSSTTPDRNTSNNADATGLIVREPAPALRAAISSPPRVLVGEHVRYRVSAIGGAPRGARHVSLCHRPPAGLLVRPAAGAGRIGGRLCRDVPRLARGQRTSFVVNAVARASAAGRTLPLLARATATDLARPARADTTVDVIALLPTGRG
ncbi:MAG TPA: choice-of-anchor A family protein [Conexibacter sp.]|nr:choice-of-anchor A family protein [Conexibacter sp.]